MFLVGIRRLIFVYVLVGTPWISWYVAQVDFNFKKVEEEKKVELKGASDECLYKNANFEFN